MNKKWAANGLTMSCGCGWKNSKERYDKSQKLVVVVVLDERNSGSDRTELQIRRGVRKGLVQ